jgi:TolA-binding protein
MKLWVFIGLLVALMSGAVYFYYSTTQTRIADLTTNNATLKTNIQTITDANIQNVKVVDELQNSYNTVQDNFSELQSQFQIARLQNNELKQRLSRHELGTLAAAKPVLVERTINNASANVQRCFELMSGAPINKKERDAQTEGQFNSECPWMWEELVQ